MNFIKNKKFIHIILIIILSLLMEIFIFNIHSFRLVGQNFQPITISLDECTVDGLEKVEENKYKITNNTAYIKINQINKELRNTIFRY